MNAPDLPYLLGGAVEGARAAGEAILRFYRDGVTVRDKADYSPVTEADVAAEALILRKLAALAPAIPIVSEEASERSGKVAAARKRKAAANKEGGKRRRVGNTGLGTQQARASQKASGGTKQAREATRSKRLKELKALAIGALSALDDQDYEAVRTALTAIAQRSDS